MRWTAGVGNMSCQKALARMVKASETHLYFARDVDDEVSMQKTVGGTLAALSALAVRGLHFAVRCA